MKHIRFSLVLAVTLALIGVGLMLSVRPAVAQGTTITSAVFSIFQQDSPNPSATVFAHRIISPWVESTVTWASFGGAFDPAPIGSFAADGTGWHTVTVTSLVQDWVNNPSQNYGLLLEQGVAEYNNYTSSEDALATNRPKLDICYTRGGPETCFTIQRGMGLSQVADSYVWSGVPGYFGGGSSLLLYTGHFANVEGDGVKYSLFRFEMRTPTAVTVQSLSARAVPTPSAAFLAIGLLGVVSAAVLRVVRRR